MDPRRQVSPSRSHQQQLDDEGQGVSSVSDAVLCEEKACAKTKEPATWCRVTKSGGVQFLCSKHLSTLQDYE